MHSPNQRSLLLFAVALLALMASCAPAPEKKAFDIVWPLPPEEPRIKYVESFASNRDVEASKGLGSAIFGEDIEERFQKPYGVAADKDGRVFVTDVGRVFVFDRKTRKLEFIGAEAGTGKLRMPIGVAVAQDGRVFITDTATDKVFVYDSRYRFITAYGQKGEFEGPSGLAIDEKRQRLYVVDSKKHNVRAYGLDGRLLMTIGERGGEPGQFNLPTNAALDSEGNLYVVDTGNFRVQSFSPEGKHLRTFGELGDKPGSLSRPKGIAVDSEDHIYVVDAAFQNFQIFDRTGQLLLFVGEAGVEPGQFSLPAGIAIDQEDRIYVVDQLNFRTQVFQYLGEKWKRAQQAAPKPAAKN